MHSQARLKGGEASGSLVHESSPNPTGLDFTDKRSGYDFSHEFQRTHLVLTSLAVHCRSSNGQLRLISGT